MRITVHYLKCDNCGKRKKINNEIYYPSGWSELSGFYAPVGHYCRACRNDAKHIAVVNGFRIWPEVMKPEEKQ